VSGSFIATVKYDREQRSDKCDAADVPIDGSLDAIRQLQEKLGLDLLAPASSNDVARL
jgi:hypothetical protein